MSNEEKKKKSLEEILLQSDDYRCELVRLTRAKADKMERINEVEKGNLLYKDDVEKTWSEAVMTIRTKLLILPSKLCQQLSLADTPKKANTILGDAIFEVLSELGSCKR